MQACGFLRPLAVSVLIVHAPSAAAAEELAIDAERRGDAIEVSARALVAASAPLVWSVLTDYEAMPGFIPGLTKSVVRQRHGSKVVVEQTGEARFLIFSFPLEVRYEVTESAPNLVTSRALAGNFKSMNGRYDLRTMEGGRTELVYRGEMEPDFALPPLIGIAALRHMIDEQFTAMVAEIERRAAAPGPAKK